MGIAKENRMQITKRTISVLIMISLLAFGLQAQNTESTTKVATTAAQFLKIGVGARSNAMGGAYVAMDFGIESIFWNPANIARISGMGEAAFNHSNWLVDTQYDFAAFSLNTTMGTIGLHFISFRVPEEEVRTVLLPEGTGQVWDANSFTLGLSYARNLTTNFSIGFTGKYIQETIFNESARTFAFDLGIFYQTPWKALKLGAAITNFGGKMQLDGRDIYFNEAPVEEDGTVNEVPAQYRMDKFEIPLSLRFGIALEAYKNETMSVLLAMDGMHPNDNQESVSTGVEVGIKNLVFLRGGYRTLFMNDSEQGLTAGLGLRYDTVSANFRIDYGWANYGRLDAVQFVTFSVGY